MRKIAAVVCFAFVIGLLTASAMAAPVSFRPVEMTQPDGTPVDLYVSGDEFYHWVHDADGYAVERDADGWIVYVGARGPEPVLSVIPVGLGDPVSMGLVIEPGPPHPPATIRAMIDSRRVQMSTRRSLAPRFGGPYHGTVNELVIFVRFSDEEEFTDDPSVFDSMFNASGEGAVSLDSYYNEVSYGGLRVQGHMFPSPAGTVLSYQDSKPRAYYQLKSDRNPDGYDDESSGLYRLGDMLDRAVSSVKSQIPADLDLDIDDDGFAENVVFIVSGDADNWADALWPHSYILLGDNYVNGVRLLAYNLQFRDWLLERSVGVLAHEFFHAIGAPDLYRYVNTDMTPAGTWDLMEYNREPPEHMTAWMKYRYGQFIDSIPQITQAGRYTLKPLTSSSDNAFQIPVPGQKYQSIVVEYRKAEGTYESSLPGSGLLVYRVDRRYNGNADGPPDELYVYRPGGHIDVDGDIDNAFMSADVGRTSIDDRSDPYMFDQDNQRIPVRIYDISEAGGTISFSVCPDIPDCIGQECGDDGCGGSCGSCDDHNDCTEDQCVDGSCVSIPVESGTPCDQGQACLGQGVCDGTGVCVPGIGLDCDDGVDCTVDSCVDGLQWVDVGEDRFEDIMTDGMDSGVDGDDVASAPLPVGFDFPFMGSLFDQVTAYDNGLLTMGGAVDPSLTPYNRAIPAADGAFHNIVAAYWDDLVCSLDNHCVVAYRTMGQGDDLRMVIQWNKVVTVAHPDDRMYFQVALFVDGRIELRYRDPGNNDGLRATVGIEGGDGASGYQFSSDSRSLRGGMTLAFTPDLMACSHRPVPGSCMVDGACVDAGTVDPDNPCLECRPLKNLGGWAADDANQCDDSNACTRADLCRSGVCEGADPVVCKAVNQCYMAGTCDTATGVCDTPLKEDGTKCNLDSNGCTVGDHCIAGTCLGGEAPDCSSKNSECAVGVCVSKSSSSFRCDADTASVLGVRCGDAAAACSGQDTCDGRGNCALNDFGSDVVCRRSIGECDLPDYCDGAGSCQNDEMIRDGTVCGWDNSRVCNAGLCVAPPSGDTCPASVPVQVGTPRRGSVAYADATGDKVEGCLSGTEPDVFFRVKLAGGVRYAVDVSPTGEFADFSFAVMNGCDQDACAGMVNSGAAGEGEASEIVFDEDVDVIVRVIKLDSSADVDFVISVRTASIDGGDEAPADASGEVVDADGGNDGANGGCSQSPGRGSVPFIPCLIILLASCVAVLAARRFRTGSIR